MKVKIVMGADHGGYLLKNVLRDYLTEQGHEVADLGCQGERVDYPDYGQLVGEAVAAGEADYGICVCGTGIGISIAVNKIPGIRGALCTNEYEAMMTRKHNNANVLVLGGRVIGEELAKDIARVFFSTDFEGGRHQNRLDKIAAIEAKYNRTI
ncbi:MAG: ribose 5-phosphate isomerase B [Eubacteriaceae bacterium]|nr:ribose 5-phosphate isomerase B [Eubacteriaceae bacterium]MBR0383647.1 ribose 5-phosphate isomerase B [Eubacteriaceae bacterium]